MTQSTSSALVNELARRLERPDSRALTRSQRLFSIATNIDVRSIAIKEDHEFFLFMEMRQECQWSSFSLTSKKWVAATHEYNTRLEALNLQNGVPHVKKNPRALVEKMEEVEAIITQRINAGDYKCKLTCLTSLSSFPVLIRFGQHRIPIRCRSGLAIAMRFLLSRPITRRSLSNQ
jgi:hypothetical protein